MSDVERYWMDDAACLTVDPETFFPDEEKGWYPANNAKRICAGCPVKAQCLADTPVWDRFSVRAGTTGSERRRKRAA